MTPTAVLAQSLGDSKVVATVPSPGYPEGIAVRGNRFYVSGPAAFGQPSGSAYVNAYDMQTGALKETYPITRLCVNQTLSQKAFHAKSHSREVAKVAKAE